MFHLPPGYRELYLASPVLFALIVFAISRYRRYRAYKKCLSHQEACEKMQDYYRGLVNGWAASLKDTKLVDQHPDNPLYGEITYSGMEKLVKKLNLGTSDVFYDLGSGVGKLVTYCYLTTPIRKSAGIEMVGDRYHTAMDIRRVLEYEGLLAQGRTLSFLHANIREAHFEDATVIYMSSLCFSNELMEELSKRFLTLKSGLRVVSTKPLFDYTRLRLIDHFLLQMTWDNHSLMYCYDLV